MPYSLALVDWRDDALYDLRLGNLMSKVRTCLLHILTVQNRDLLCCRHVWERSWQAAPLPQWFSLSFSSFDILEDFNDVRVSYRSVVCQSLRSLAEAASSH